MKSSCSDPKKYTKEKLADTIRAFYKVVCCMSGFPEQIKHIQTKTITPSYHHIALFVNCGNKMSLIH